MRCTNWQNPIQTSKGKLFIENLDVHNFAMLLNQKVEPLHVLTYSTLIYETDL